MSSQNDNVICLSSGDDSDDSDCCIVEEPENADRNAKNEVGVVSNIKSSSASTKTEEASESGNGDRGRRFSTSATSTKTGTTSAEPEVVDLIDSGNEGFEIEYPNEAAETEENSRFQGDDDQASASAGREHEVEDNEAKGSNKEENYFEATEREVEKFKQAIEDNKPPLSEKIQQKHINKAKAIIQKAFDDARFLPKDEQLILQGEIRHAKERLMLDTAAGRKKYWIIISDLKSVVESAKLGQLANDSFNTKEMREKENDHKLKSIQKKIKDLERQEVDWDEDEHNSSYMLVGRYVQRLMTTVYKNCDLTGCSRAFGRPVQKTIRLEKHGAGSGYRAIDLEIERFINQQGCLFAPTLKEILSIVEDVNRNEKLGLSKDEETEIGTSTADSIMKILKKRRGKDLHDRLLIDDEDMNIIATDATADDEDGSIVQNYVWNDPVDDDPVLRQKLEDNFKQRKSLSEAEELFHRNYLNKEKDAEHGNGSIEVSEDEDECEEASDIIVDDALSEDGNEICEIDDNGNSVTFQTINTGGKRKSNEEVEEVVEIDNNDTPSNSRSSSELNALPLKKGKFCEN